MCEAIVEIAWPNGNFSMAKSKDNFLELAYEAGIEIPTGCLGGSCGACEIEVNGKIIRACISEVSEIKSENLKVEFVVDPYWD